MSCRGHLDYKELTPLSDYTMRVSLMLSMSLQMLRNAKVVGMWGNVKSQIKCACHAAAARNNQTMAGHSVRPVCQGQQLSIMEPQAVSYVSQVNESCLRPQCCTCQAILDRGKAGLMR